MTLLCPHIEYAYTQYLMHSYVYNVYCYKNGLIMEYCFLAYTKPRIYIYLYSYI